MKTCPQCNAMVSDTAKFCIKCGFNIKKYEEENTNQKLFCPECGEQIPLEADFCPECGAKIEKEAFLNDDSNSTEIDFSALANINVELAKQLKEKEFSAFEYDEHSDGSYTITGLKDKTALKYVVPDKVEGIANGAFKGSEAITVTLPEGLMKIGDQAFKDCKNLTQINLPKSLKFIGNEAFFNCELLNIEIPSYVIRVGSNAIKNTLKDLERQKAEAEAKAKKEAEERALKEAEAKNKAEAEERAKKEAEERVIREAEAKIKAEAEAKAKAEAEAKAKKEAEERAKKEAEERAIREAEAKIKAEAEAKAKKEAEEKERWQAEAKSRKTVGSTITFGSYYQSNKDQKEPIKWQVLAVEGNKSLIISEKILDNKEYHNWGRGGVIWKYCTLRSWLNNDFKNSAFNVSEQQIIQTTTVLNKNNEVGNTQGGPDTTDSIFVLSIEEINKYYSTDDAKMCLATAYAKINRMHVAPNGNSYWWLRSPGSEQDKASFVNEFGDVCIYGSMVSYHHGVRPALWINNE